MELVSNLTCAAPGSSIPYFKVFIFEAFLFAGIAVNFLYVHRAFLLQQYRRVFPKAPEGEDDTQPLVASSPTTPSYMLSERERIPLQSKGSGEGRGLLGKSQLDTLGSESHL